MVTWFPRALGLALVAVTGVAQAAPSVTAAATAGATDLTLDGEGTSQSRIVKIADVTAGTDSTSGFTLTIGSGQLTCSSAATPIAFQVALVADGAAPPTASDFTVSSGSPYVWTTGSAGTAQRDLYIRYQAADLQDPGSYSASVSLSIIDN